MFITVKRHEREKQELLGISNRLTEAVLKNTDQGLFMLDAAGNLLPTISQSLPTMFRRKDFANLTFEKLLIPVVSPKTLGLARIYIAALLGAARDAPPPANTLTCVDMRLTNSDGSFDNAHYSFAFDSVANPGEPQFWLVRVSDITARIQLTRDVEELRGQVQTQGEILRGVLQMGGARFGIFMQKTDESMKTINTVLKKPAREADAFRQKIEETLDEVDRIRREAAAFKLSALVGSARIFEDALHDLRSRSELSGSDFLPVAVKLDQLYSQFALVKSLTIAAAPARDRDAAAPVPGMTENGTLILAAPRMVVDTPDLKTAPVTQRTAPAGSLDGALQSLTEHVAQEQNRDVVLQSSGLRLVPPKYQAAIKNVAIQLIRNAVMHGIEPAAARQAAGKPARGTLRLHFKVKNEGFQLLFEDDGRGIDPHTVRATAIARGVSTPEAAANMRDREAIKLIFKSRYTTLADSATDCRHGAGMSLVRRYVHESGGKIALASVPGRETRFKIILPPLETPGVEAPVEVAAAISAAPSEAAVAASQEASASIKSPQAIDALLNGQPLVQAEAAPTAVDAGQRALEADAARDAPMPTNKADSHDAHAAPEAKTHSDPNAVTVVLADTTTQVA